MSRNNQHHNHDSKEQPKINWILVIFFAIAVFFVFFVLTFIVLNLLNVKNIILGYIVVFLVGYSMGYTIYRNWVSIRLFISPPRTPEDKKKDKYGFARDAFILGSGAIYFNFLILLFYRDNLDFIKSYTEIYTLTWSTAAATKISIGVFAIFAFIVTVWRGNLHSAQVDSQIKQLDLGNRQFEESNKQFDLANKQYSNAVANLVEVKKNNVVKLLFDSAKSLDTKNKVEQTAAIACLANIIEGQSSFSFQAIDILVSFINSQPHETDSDIPLFKIFNASNEEHSNVFAALRVINRYGELQKEPVWMTKIAVTTNETEYRTFEWLSFIVYYNVKIYFLNSQKSFCVLCHSNIENGCFDSKIIIWKKNTFANIRFDEFNIGYDLRSADERHSDQMKDFFNLIDWMKTESAAVLRSCEYNCSNTFVANKNIGPSMEDFFVSRGVVKKTT